jgi:hypothetical protein
MATQPAQIISTRSSVRDQEGFRWGLGGAWLIDGLPMDFHGSMQDRLARNWWTAPWFLILDKD